MYPALLPLLPLTTADAHSSAASSRLNSRPRDLNELVRFTERRNLVSALVPSHFKCSLPPNHKSDNKVLVVVSGPGPAHILKFSHIMQNFPRVDH